MQSNLNTNSVFFIGPCSMESREITIEIAGELKRISEKLKINVVFKSSFDKANRTSFSSYRSLGLQKGLNLLSEIKSQFSMKLITDVHETSQVAEVAEIVDVIQVPAFLCRQTDLLIACGKSNKEINIKKGQFMAPEDMRYSVEKVMAGRTDFLDRSIYVTERGTTFGYHNLVVDMRSLPIMRQFSKCIFDVTHSTQRPGALDGASGGDRKWAPVLARAAAAVGVDGYFIETHPQPERALSDGPLMIPLNELEELLTQLIQIENSINA